MKKPEEVPFLGSRSFSMQTKKDTKNWRNSPFQYSMLSGMAVAIVLEICLLTGSREDTAAAAVTTLVVVIVHKHDGMQPVSHTPALGHHQIKLYLPIFRFRVHVMNKFLNVIIRAYEVVMVKSMV